MEVDKQLRFKSHKNMTVEFFLTNVDVMTHSCMSSVALALVVTPLHRGVGVNPDFNTGKDGSPSVWLLFHDVLGSHLNY